MAILGDFEKKLDNFEKCYYHFCFTNLVTQYCLLNFVGCFQDGPIHFLPEITISREGPSHEHIDQNLGSLSLFEEIGSEMAFLTWRKQK